MFTACSLTFFVVVSWRAYWVMVALAVGMGIASMSAAGMRPRAASTSHTASSTSSQARYWAGSDHSSPIASRV